MGSSRSIIPAVALAILVCTWADADDQRRGFAQSRAVISGGKVFAMGEFRLGKQMGWPGRLLLQTDDLGGSLVQEYVLPVVASHSLEGGETRTCWSLSPDTVWAMVESDDVTKERTYHIVSVTNASLGSFAVKDAVVPPQKETPSRGVSRAEALPMQVQQGLRAQMLLDYTGSGSPLPRRGFDIHAIGDGEVALWLLIGSRMTVWCYSPGGYASIDGVVIGPYRIEGPPMCTAGQWKQLATFDVPFQSPFRVIHEGSAACLWTADGSFYLCTGLDARRPDISLEPIISGSEDCYTLDKKAVSRFLGQNERRIAVRRVLGPSNASMVLEDIDRGRAWILDGVRVRHLDAIEQALPLTEPLGAGEGLIADAMDMVRAITASHAVVGEPNAAQPRRPERGEPPAKEEKPSGMY